MTKDIVAARLLSGNEGSNKKRRLKAEKKGRTRPKKRKKRDKYRNLSFVAVNKMITQFLSCGRLVMVEERRLKYSKKELAEKLKITVEEIENIRAAVSYENLVNKITLPLVTLYCSTKWDTDK